MNVKSAAAGAAGALGLSGTLLMWVVNEQAKTEVAHAELHRKMAIQIAKLEARLDYHHGEPTAWEADAEAAAEAAVEATKP